LASQSIRLRQTHPSNKEKNMRIPLWIFILLLPALCLAQAEPGKPSTGSAAVRIMSVEPTQTVHFVGSLDDLQEHLQLTAAQQASWALYRASVEAYSQLFFGELPLASYASEPATRQVERLAERLQSRAHAMQEIARTSKALYAVLNGAQQKTADRHLLASIPVFGYPPASN
jgi:hypothetical protein